MSVLLIEGTFVVDIYALGIGFNPLAILYQLEVTTLKLSQLRIIFHIGHNSGEVAITCPPLTHTQTLKP